MPTGYASARSNWRSKAFAARSMLSRRGPRSLPLPPRSCPVPRAPPPARSRWPLCALQVAVWTRPVCDYTGVNGPPPARAITPLTAGIRRRPAYPPESLAGPAAIASSSAESLAGELDKLNAPPATLTVAAQVCVVHKQTHWVSEPAHDSSVWLAASSRPPPARVCGPRRPGGAGPLLADGSVHCLGRRRLRASVRLPPRKRCMCMRN